MHFEFMVEDQSGKIALSILIPKIIGIKHTFRIHEYKGLGSLPPDLRDAKQARRQILLYRLPEILKGHGKSYNGDINYPLIVVCDLDIHCLKAYRNDVRKIAESCDPHPAAYFCFAIEELEAWYLGDLNAVSTAYPRIRMDRLKSYLSDSVCNTWELLADATLKGGSKNLKEQGWPATGKAKCEWASSITPHMNIDSNSSPSFCYFRDKLRMIVQRGRG